MIIDKKEIPKNKSLNSTYNGTDKWTNSTEVIKLTTQNGGASITDEIPGGGIVKQRITAQEQKIRNNELQSTNNISLSITSSSSELSMSPQQSSEENYDVLQKSKESRIPIRSKSNISLSSNNSSLSHSDLFRFSKIPVPKKKEKDVLLKPKVYGINEKTREALLSANHPFLKDNPEIKIDDAISFHKNDRVRVKNLEDEDIAELRNSKRQVMIFSR